MKKKKRYSREFKIEAVQLITEKGYSIAEASRNLGVEYSVLRSWKKQLTQCIKFCFTQRASLFSNYTIIKLNIYL
jgi:transposase-like protein